MMQIAGLKASNLWAHRILRDRGVETVEMLDQLCQAQVMVEQVLVHHHGNDLSYRPYLQVCGQLRSIVPADSDTTWPCDIEEITYGSGDGENIDAFYEFDDQQLVDLVNKGYFEGRLEVPEAVVGISWELPAVVDVLVVPPIDEQDVPVVFARVHDAGDLHIDLASTGYDLVANLPDRSATRMSLDTEDARPQVRTHTGAFEDMFAEEPLVVAKDSRVMTMGDPDVGQDVVGSSAGRDQADRELAVQLAAERSRIQEAEAKEKTRREHESGTQESLYRQAMESVAPSGGDALDAAGKMPVTTTQPQPEQDEGDNFADLDEASTADEGESAYERDRRRVLAAADVRGGSDREADGQVEM